MLRTAKFVDILEIRIFFFFLFFLDESKCDISICRSVYKSLYISAPI